MRRTILVVVGLFALLSAQAANDSSDLQEILALSKTAGACGVMQQMAEFQRTTKISGGDEFMFRFWSAEFARLGKTQDSFIKECEFAIGRYDAYWKAAESKVR